MLLAFQLMLNRLLDQVTDENGIPLPGATVIVEGTSNGVVTTNFDGNFSIETSRWSNPKYKFRWLCHRISNFRILLKL